MWEVTLPLKIRQSKSKWFHLNLNNYRNAHYQTLNKVKVNFTEEVLPLLKGIPPMERCYLRYVLYLPTARKTDVANVGSVVDKFFSDALVKSGVLPDDNYDHLPMVVYEFAEIDRKNPRAVVEIHQIGEIDETCN